jgi:putative radical SAM enzyme (TIGR03279 family)
MEQLKALSERRIELHCQIVLVPGQNDGPELERTVNDLLSLWPAVQSVAVVPVGLTGHRDHLPKLRLSTSVEARQVIDFLLPLGRQMQRRLGVSFAYLADEWFVLAESIVPERGYYDDFPQIENGIGLTRQLLDEALPSLRKLPRSLSSSRRVFWVTGKSAANVLRRLAERLNQVEGLWVDVLPVANTLFGESVTVTGLVAGADIVEALNQVATDGATVLIPDVMLRPLEQDFLDDVTFAELKEAFPKARVILTPTNGHSLVQYSIEEEVDQCQ